MNKTVKIILIIAACLIPIGALITFLGLRAGATKGWSVAFNGNGNTVRTDVVDKKVDLDEFDKLQLEISSADVVVTTGDAFTISYKTREGEEPVVTQESGSLTVKQPSKGFVMFDFGFGEGLDNYVITIPDGKTADLTAHISSGDLTFDRVGISGSITSSSGDVMLNDVEGDDLTVKTSSGEIYGDKVKVGKCDFSSSSGDIALLRVNTDAINCITSSGDISLFNSEAGDISCKASSGEISMGLNSAEADHSYDIHTSSGDIVLNGVEYEKNFSKEAGAGKISLETSSGDIDIQTK